MEEEEEGEEEGEDGDEEEEGRKKKKVEEEKKKRREGRGRHNVPKPAKNLSNMSIGIVSQLFLSSLRFFFSKQ